MTSASPRRSRVSSRLQTKAKQTAVSLTSVWRWAVAAVLLAAGAAASSWAHTAPRSATSLPALLRGRGRSRPSRGQSGMLVYAYGYELHSVRVDGTHDRTLLRADAPVSSPTLSADGRLIAFDEGATTHEIWLMNRDVPERATSPPGRCWRSRQTEHNSRSAGADRERHGRSRRDRSRRDRPADARSRCR